MPKYPNISGKDLLIILYSLGFELIRVNGSHHRLKHSDGRVTTVPIHSNKILPKGLLHKIIKEDLLLTTDEFLNFIK